jgi:putative hydrolase of the HAD superfamily
MPEPYREDLDPARPYLLIDAGGTFVFIDQELLSQVLASFGFNIGGLRLYSEHFRAIHWFDSYVREHGRFPPRMRKPYTQLLFELAGVPEHIAVPAAVLAEARHQERNLWTFTFPWAVEALDRLLDEGYRLSVISNADGRVSQQLDELGLSHYFERVFDSALVGTAKPDPRIFELALHELGLRAEDALFVGDMFYIDVWGANRAGIPALHLDPLGLYEGWPGEHIGDLSILPDWLVGYAKDGDAYDMHPLKGFSLCEEDGPGQPTTN